MKKIATNILKLFVVSLVLGFVISCSDDDEGNQISEQEAQTIVDIALETSDLSSLVSALQAADGDLVSVLEGTGPFTVLAPTNEAFSAFLSANGFASLEEVPTDLLAEILLNHVISGEVTSSDLAALGTGYSSTSASGAGNNNISIYFDATNGVRFNDVSNVTAGGADVEASNGVIHIVDAVIPLPTIVSHATANSAFTSLVDALGSADGNLVDVLSGDGPFTVLAPDNAAFESFLNGEDLNNIDTAVLARILLNHVVSGTLSSSDLSAEQAGYTNTSTTGPGDQALSLYFNTSSGVVFNGTSTVTTADVVATNGIIHAVDAVIDLPTVVTFATADPNFSTLVEALTTLTPGTDFASILSRTEGGNGDGINPDFTVFAPTNDAFDALSSIPDEPELTQVLLHHVVAAANVTSSDLTPNGDTVAATLEGDNITITLPGSGSQIADVTDGSGNTDIGIIAVDVQADNGVIHVLNKVMLPDTTN